MTEKQKRDAGELYNPNYDEELGIEIVTCKEKCHRYNMLSPVEFEEKANLLDNILGSHGQNTTILSPFWCDYGYNTKRRSDCADIPLSSRRQGALRLGIQVFKEA